ncbi:Uncharacterised protein [Campylobacter coli]|nr:hypothetical protein ATE51_02594 [Campylobacter coli]EIA40617.1 hypothetical protein cco1_08824 [Campylobacter coli 111-3]EIA69182.1 hypothetical protein cco4_07701 [Campylobacter coli 7--1]EIA78371.1 hypothetical protein cco6_09241 [Campylobacter coli 59-2]EIA79170.1 hypothetical protein cco65_09128 [Campylobacter coli 1957]EIA84280.1 hypothetical protein cco7_08082 [Campylobacter coli 67-8]EIB05627.1 hypothetical protein cco88_09377 [Campylobacter coli LMG 9860]
MRRMQDREEWEMGIKGVINEGINDENYSMKCSG